jgi:predicted dehydrogenase
MKPLRLGLAGCGRVATRGYLPAAHDLPSVEFVAFADPDIRRARAASDFDRPAARSKSKALDEEGVFATVEELVAAGGAEALVVATPAENHGEAAALAARAGIPSLIEKPPAPDLAGALGLASLDPAPSLGFNRRFLQGLDLAPRIPAEGWLELELELCFRRGGWGAHVSRDEALLDAGTHLIDLAAFLTASAPIAVRGVELSQERASLELELGRGRARLRCRTDARFAERVVVRDRAGRTLASSTIDGLRARLARLRGSPNPIVLSLRRQLVAFAARVHQEGGGALASAEDGAVAMAVVAAARLSAELGGAEVTVDRPPAPSPESIA